jgi:hypothetical protein
MPIYIQFHSIPDVAREELILQHFSTNKIVVDPLTEATARGVFQTNVKSLGLRI